MEVRALVVVVVHVAVEAVLVAPLVAVVDRMVVVEVRASALARRIVCLPVPSVRQRLSVQRWSYWGGCPVCTGRQVVLVYWYFDWRFLRVLWQSVRAAVVSISGQAMVWNYLWVVAGCIQPLVAAAQVVVVAAAIPAVLYVGLHSVGASILRLAAVRVSLQIQTEQIPQRLAASVGAACFAAYFAAAVSVAVAAVAAAAVAFVWHSRRRRQMRG